MKVIFAYDNKVGDDFVPNGCLPEDKDKSWVPYGQPYNPTDVLKPRFYSPTLYDRVSFELDNIELEELSIQDASSQQEKFIIPFWTDGTQFRQWSGEQDGYGDIFATLSELSISEINIGKAVIVFCFMDSCGRYIGCIIPYILTQAKKYGIKGCGIWYVTNELSFKNEYKIWNRKYNRKYNTSKFNVITAPYLWGFTKALYETESDNDNRHQFQHKNDLYIETLKPKKYLCLSRIPRIHRTAVAIHLWKNYYDDGYLSFYDKDYDRSEYTDWDWDFSQLKNSKNYNYLRENFADFKKELPLVVDKDFYKDHWHDILKVNLSWMYKETYFSIVQESASLDYERCITEKPFRCILNFHPFINVGSPYILKELKAMGFKTFHPYINEQYDEIEKFSERIDCIMQELDRLCSMSLEELDDMHKKLIPVLIHNYDLFWREGHFFRDVFTEILGSNNT